MFNFLRLNKSATPAGAERGSEEVGCFGKLPIRADFLKHNASHREGIALDHWIQDGYGLMSRRGRHHQGPANPRQALYHAVFAGSEDDRTVLATIAPSRDRSGREYPFVVFALVRPPSLQDVLTTLPAQYGDFFAQAAHTARQPWRNEPLTTVAAFLTSMHGNLPKVRRDDVAAAEYGLLTATSISDFWKGLGSNVPAELRAPFIHALTEALQAVRRRTPMRTPWGLRLPLPVGEGAETALTFWLRLVTAMLEPGSHRMNYFWTVDPRAAQLTVFFRPAPPSFLAHILDTSVRDGTVLDAVADALERHTASQSAWDIASAERGDLMDLLRRFAHAGRRT